MAGAIISRRIASVGAPDVVIPDNDPRFSLAKVQQFRRDNSALQTVIRGNRQSLVGTARRHMYFRDITQRIKDGRQEKKVDNREWGDYASMCMMHLNSQVQPYGGFTNGQRVFGRGPKLSIGAVDNPHFKGAIYQNGSPFIQTKERVSEAVGISQIAPAM